MELLTKNTVTVNSLLERKNRFTSIQKELNAYLLRLAKMKSRNTWPPEIALKSALLKPLEEKKKLFIFAAILYLIFFIVLGMVITSLFVTAPWYHILFRYSVSLCLLVIIYASNSLSKVTQKMILLAADQVDNIVIPTMNKLLASLDPKVREEVEILFIKGHTKNLGLINGFVHMSTILENYPNTYPEPYEESVSNNSGGDTTEQEVKA